MTRPQATNTNDFLRTRLNYAIVLRGDLNQIEELKRVVAELGMVVVFQKVAPMGIRLWIKEDTEAWGRGGER